MSEFEFLEPLDQRLLEEVKLEGHPKQIGRNVDFYHSLTQVDFKSYDLAILGVAEFRSSNTASEKVDFSKIRRAFYQLFPGNWKSKILDLGNIQAGNSQEDTLYLLEKILATLLKNKVIPLILGGSKDLVYAQYRAYSEVKYMVNHLSVSHSFDLGDADLDLATNNYLSHIIVKKPYNLFNYTNLGYQTFYVNQDEIDLMERLFFETYRLGHIKSNLHFAEPLLRDTDFASFDFTCLKSSEVADSTHFMVNGFNAQEFCAMARYAGISDRLSSFGMYEIQKFNQHPALISLVAQVMWYFVEGLNFRFNEEYPQFNQNFTKFTVPIEDENLIFLESKVSGRWWIEIPLANKDNKPTEKTFISCSKEDYLSACELEYPERWVKSKIKNEL